MESPSSSSASTWPKNTRHFHFLRDSNTNKKKDEKERCVRSFFRLFLGWEQRRNRENSDQKRRKSPFLFSLSRCAQIFARRNPFFSLTSLGERDRERCYLISLPSLPFSQFRSDHLSIIILGHICADWERQNEKLDSANRGREKNSSLSLRVCLLTEREAAAIVFVLFFFSNLFFRRRRFQFEVRDGFFSSSLFRFLLSFRFFSQVDESSRRSCLLIRLFLGFCWAVCAFSLTGFFCAMRCFVLISRSRCHMKEKIIRFFRKYHHKMGSWE